jgi:hypothetical protein
VNRFVSGVLLALVGFAAAPVASAQDVRGLYFGGGVGATYLSVFDNNNNDDCCYYNNDYNYNYESSDAYASFTAFVGYRFGRYVAAEVGYFYVDNPEWDENYTFVGDLNDVFTSRVKLDYESTQVSVLGILPFGHIWEAYVRGGAAFSHSQADQHLIRATDGALFDRSVDNDDTQFLFGIGIGISPAPMWHFRFEATTVPIDNDSLNTNGDASIDGFKVEVQFRPFVRSEAQR